MPKQNRRSSRNRHQKQDRPMLCSHIFDANSRIRVVDWRDDDPVVMGHEVIQGREGPLHSFMKDELKVLETAQQQKRSEPFNAPRPR